MEIGWSSTFSFPWFSFLKDLVQIFFSQTRKTWNPSFPWKSFASWSSFPVKPVWDPSWDIEGFEMMLSSRFHHKPYFAQKVSEIEYRNFAFSILSFFFFFFFVKSLFSRKIDSRIRFVQNWLQANLFRSGCCVWILFYLWKIAQAEKRIWDRPVFSIS